MAAGSPAVTCPRHGCSRVLAATVAEAVAVAVAVVIDVGVSIVIDIVVAVAVVLTTNMAATKVSSG